MKISWRKIVEDWKKGPGKREAAIPKDKFPILLKKLCDSLKEENVQSGFKKCGILPLNRTKVLQALPCSETSSSTPSGIQTPLSELPRVAAIDETFKELL